MVSFNEFWLVSDTRHDCSPFWLLIISEWWMRNIGHCTAKLALQSQYLFVGGVEFLRLPAPSFD